MSIDSRVLCRYLQSIISHHHRLLTASRQLEKTKETTSACTHNGMDHNGQSEPPGGDISHLPQDALFGGQNDDCTNASLQRVNSGGTVCSNGGQKKQELCRASYASNLACSESRDVQKPGNMDSGAVSCTDAENNAENPGTEEGNTGPRSDKLRTETPTSHSSEPQPRDNDVGSQQRAPGTTKARASEGRGTSFSGSSTQNTKNQDVLRALLDAT